MKNVIIVAAVANTLAGSGFAQDAENGEKLFKKCASCHQIGPEATNKTGPILTGILGRPAGTVEGFKYSKSMVAAGQAGLVWSQDSIVEYIADPKAYLRKVLDDPKARAKMTFKLKKEDERQDVVAYLGTFQTASAAPANGFCIMNASDKSHFFVTETREGDRQLAQLDPGAQLCADGTDAADGIVSVFESEDGFEGCSRIIAVGTTEQMLEYAEFDRCGWSSHKS